MMVDLSKQHEQIHADLGWKRLSKGWAKCEILLGLFCVALGLILLTSAGATHAVAQTPRNRLLDEVGDVPAAETAAGLALFVLGGYLALAGHRSHLYQSNLQLTAYLTEQLRQARGPQT